MKHEENRMGEVQIIVADPRDFSAGPKSVISVDPPLPFGDPDFRPDFYKRKI